jgi:Na+-driven multidrug efflux pump
LSGNKLQLRSDQYNTIDTFVAQHLGISTAAAAGVVWPNQNLLLPIVGKVLTGATIATL